MLSEQQIDSLVKILEVTKELTTTNRICIADKYHQIGRVNLWDSAFKAGRLSEFEYYQLKALRMYQNKIT